MKLSLVILCYNDGLSCKELLPDCIKELESHFEDYELIVVDDGSTDDSCKILEEIANSFPKMKAIFHEQNKGVGQSFSTGIEAAKLPISGYMDGDSQFSPADLPKMVKLLDQHHMVSGIRVKRADPIFRLWVSAFYNSLIRNIYGIDTKDINCGLKVFRTDSLRKAMPLHSGGPFFDAEMLIRFKNMGFSVAEIGVMHFPRKFGKAGGISRNNLRKTFSGIIGDDFSRFWMHTLRSKLSVALVRLMVRLLG